MELLERDAPLRELDVALISGEASIGKTSLVERFTHEHRPTARALWGACDSLFTPRPLGPLHDIAAQTQGDLLARLTSESDRTAIFSTFLSELQHETTIVVIEDVHWADEATLDLLKYLGRRIQRTRALLIATYRDDETGPQHPLRIVLGDLATSTATRRLSLAPLSLDAVRTLVAERPFDAAALHRQTDGNPFFVTEVLASEAKGASAIPSTVRDAVLARTARLSPSARAVLEAAAVIGQRIEPWLLADVTGAEAKAAEECLVVGVLLAQGDVLAFRHELARQIIFEAISPQQKLVLHRLVLDALKSSPITRQDLARLAHHAEALGDHDAVLEYAPAAARQASAASSHREACAFYELALRFADALPPVEYAQMLEAYDTELAFTNRLADEIIALQKAIEIWHSIGNRLREGMNLAELSAVLIMVGRNKESEDASQDAIATLEALPPSAELAWAYNRPCFLRMMLRDCTDAVAWGEKAIALAEHFEDAEKLARTYNYTGCAMMVVDYDRGCALLEQCVSLALKESLPYAVAGALGNLAGMSVEVYQFTYVGRYLDEGIAYAIKHDDDYQLVETLSFQALIHLYQGHWTETEETALNVMQRSGTNIVARTYAHNALGRLRVRRGDSNALTLLDEALALSTQADAIPRIGTARAARAEAFWLAGDHDRAHAEACAAYDIALSKKHPWVAGELAFWRWRAGDKITLPEWIAKPFALQIVGDWRAAAEEWKGRGCPYEQAMALMDGDEAAQLAALEIFERLGARPAAEIVRQKLQAIPARRREKEKFGGLTEREREVAALIAQGKSNREIAETMTVGVKTVETYVTRILNKLGFDSRVQIATWAKDKGLA